nr:acyltransferase family protein [uncultured Cohaesibacter sp.]
MKQQDRQIGYRPDVDGIRAFAVLAVFLFHLDFAFIPGGFVGVDVFYVISGYVILRSVVPDLKAGQFSLMSFYDRRVRRIYPALILAVLLSIVVGYFIATPKEFESLGGSAAASLLSGSNIYFNDRLGYFAAAAKTIPLLHTWSLGVEFQFYLLVPLLLLVVVRLFGNNGRAILIALLALVGLSFLANLVTIYLLLDSKLAFYMPMTRFWEIGLGGLIAFWDGRFRVGRGLSLFLTWLAIAGLVASVILIDQTVAFPGVIALLPVLASAILVMLLPGEGSFYHRLVTSGPALFFGRISYSLYLFHWPMIVFPSLYLGRELALPEKALIFVAATVLSYVSWKFVETPIRRARQGRKRQIALSTMGGGVLLLCLICLQVIMSSGLPARLNPEARQIYNQLINPKPSRSEVIDCEPVSGLHGIRKASISSCLYSGKGTKAHVEFVLWGDSHAGMLWHQMRLHMDEVAMSGILAVMPDCAPLLDVYTSKLKNRAECSQLGQYLQQIVKERGVPVVVLATRWGNYSSSLRAPGDGALPKTLYDDDDGGAPIPFLKALSRTVEYFTGLGARVVLVGPVPEIDFNVPEMLIRSVNLGFPLPKASRAEFDARQRQTMAALQRFSANRSVTLVYPHRHLCDEDQCRTVAGQTPLYIDDDHLSEQGVKLILPEILAAIRAAGNSDK